MSFNARVFGFLIFLSLAAPAALAQGQKVSLQLLNKSPDGLKWMIQGTGLAAGDILTVGNSCRLRVDQVRQGRAIVLTKDCPIRDKAKKGQRFSALHTPAGGASSGGLTVTEASESDVPETGAATPETRATGGAQGRLLDGFRAGVRFGSLVGEFEVAATAQKVELARSFGISLGYGSASTSGFGYLLEGVYDSYDEGSAVRGEGLGVYGLGSRLYAMAGVIGNFILPDQDGAESNFGYGFKGGAGFAITPSILIEASYIYIHHQWKLAGDVSGDVNMNITGLEFGLSYAF